MKKLFVVIIVFIIILNGANKETNFSLLNYFSGKYTAYTSTNSGDNGVDLGFCYMNSQPIKKDVIGESIVIENLEVASAIETLNARVVKNETLEDGTVVIYCYSNLIKEKMELFGKMVNLQIATKGDITVIGWPLIMGSF